LLISEDVIFPVHEVYSYNTRNNSAFFKDFSVVGKTAKRPIFLALHPG
jgi:hypothetical protein